MAIYTFQIHDDRRSVPTRGFVRAENARLAKRWASQTLSNSSHYNAIEVYEDEGLKFIVKRSA